MKLSKESYKIAQKIWSSTDVILLIFAGSAAEFAAIKAVDWLFYTNRLPSAPIDRLFDTARFAQGIFFSDPATASNTLETINRIHLSVEKSRKMDIPDWAYRDVLYMLIDYSEKGHKVVFGEMTDTEKAAYFEAAREVGIAMNLRNLPNTYEEFLIERKRQLRSDYEKSQLTTELFKKYLEALGTTRYEIMKMVQASLIPDELKDVLLFKKNPLISFLLNNYRFLPGRGEKLKLLHRVLLPAKYYNQLKKLGKPESSFSYSFH